MSKYIMDNNTYQQSRAEKQAMYYVDKLCCGRIDNDVQVTDLLLELENWQKKGTENSKAFARAMDSWADLAHLENDAKVQSWAETNIPSATERNTGRKTWHAGRLAFGLAATVLVVVVSWVFYSNDSEHSGAELLARYTTIVGEQRTVHLLDGSSVTLNTDSSLLLEYTKGYRRAILDYGEVFFDVKTDVERPFTVETGARSITVLGTQFNVQKIHSQLTVAVVEGSVALHPKEERASKQVKAPDFDRLGVRIHEGDVVVPVNQQFRLEAGMVLGVDNAGKLILLTQNNPDTLGRYADWLGGKIRFKNQPLQQVVEEINRYARRKVIIDDMELMKDRITVVFNVENLDVFLAGLEVSLPVRVARYSDNIVISRVSRTPLNRN